MTARWLTRLRDWLYGPDTALRLQTPKPAIGGPYDYDKAIAGKRAALRREQLRRRLESRRGEASNVVDIRDRRIQ